jgi:hypothetical protein
MTHEEALAAWKRFLESVPPNTPEKFENLAEWFDTGHSSGWRIANSTLQLHCDHDGGVRRFECQSDYVYCGDEERRYHFMTYVCRDCQGRDKTFAVVVTKPDASHIVQAMKLGEFPPFSAPISARVQKLLGKEDLQMYRKGSRAEAQGLGVGAASYFRRVVESQWRLLVTEIRDAAAKLGVSDLAVYEAALKETQFSTAVEMLRDAIPAKLLILNGQNPLTLLHQPLSVQLHTLTDAECLQQAADIRLVLTALLENIGEVLKQQDHLKDAAARLSQANTARCGNKA